MISSIRFSFIGWHVHWLWAYLRVEIVWITWQVYPWVFTDSIQFTKFSNLIRYVKFSYWLPRKKVIKACRITKSYSSKKMIFWQLGRSQLDYLTKQTSIYGKFGFKNFSFRRIFVKFKENRFLILGSATIFDSIRKLAL